MNRVLLQKDCNSARTHKDVVSSSVKIHSGCDSGLTNDGYSCYETSFGSVAVKAYSGLSSWEKAKTKCSQDGTGAVKGELAVPQNSIENEWFVKKARKLGITGTFWLGVNDIVEEGSYKTYYDDATSYLNWGPQQPSSLSASDQDCIVTSGGWDYGWDDTECDRANGVLCTHVVYNPGNF